MLHQLFAVTLLLICLSSGVECKDYDSRLDGGVKDSPGAKMRLTTTGLAYIREIAMNVLNRELRKLVFPKITTDIDPEGTVTISNMKVIDYWAPTEYHLDMEPTDEFSWTMINMGIRTAGDFAGSAKLGGLPLRASGSFDSLIPHLAFSMTIKLGVNKEGYPTVKASRCEMYIDKVDLILKGDNLISNALNLFKSTITSQIKPTLQTEVCKRVTKIVDEDANKMMSTLPLKVPLSATRINGNATATAAVSSRSTTVRRTTRKNAISGSTMNALAARFGNPVTARPGRGKRQTKNRGDDYYDYYDYGNDFTDYKPSDVPARIQIADKEYKTLRIKNSDFEEMIEQIRSKDLILDLTMTRAPTIAPGYAMTMHKAEISWQGKGGSPFYPPPIGHITPKGNEMVQLYISDYVANTLLYHAYKRKLLDIGIKADQAPNLDKLLRTTCVGTTLCLGDLMFAVGTTFPNHYVDMTITPDEAPFVVINNKGIEIEATGELNMYARKINGPDRGVKIVTADMKLRAFAEIGFSDNGQRIGGSMKVTELTMKKTYSRLTGTVQGTLDDLAKMSRTVITKMATGVLEKGIPMPKVKGLEFRKPTMMFNTHNILVETYFVIDEDYVNELVAKAVSKVTNG